MCIFRIDLGNIKITDMKNLIVTVILTVLVLIAGCKKDTTSERFRLLTTPVWTPDSLLANGFDASGPGQILAGFLGDAKFNEDGTGYFGDYEGKWYFAFNETQIVIQTDSLPLPLTTIIKELTTASLKITTSVPNAFNPASPISIRMTFKAN